MSMRPPKIKWRGKVRTFDAYQLHEAFLWGAKACLYPGTVTAPLHPVTQEEFFVGHEIAAKGHISMVPDADPREIVRRLKQEHQLKRAERAGAA
jgi:hypothetical protein